MSYALMKDTDYQTISKLADALAKSGFFRDAQNASQAFAKILAGAEMGLTPFAAMTSFHCIEGRLAPSANTYAAFIRRHPHYDYVVLKHSATECEVEFYRGEKDQNTGRLTKPELLGVHRTTFDDMQRRGITQGKEGLKKNWKGHPDAMLFARAISQGARTFCPDVFQGALIYTREELEDVEVRDVEAEVRDAPAFEPGSDAEMGQAEAQAAADGREVEIDEPAWDLGPTAQQAKAAGTQPPPVGGA